MEDVAERLIELRAERLLLLDELNKPNGGKRQELNRRVEAVNAEIRKLESSPAARR